MDRELRVAVVVGATRTSEFLPDGSCGEAMWSQSQGALLGRSDEFLQLLPSLRTTAAAMH